MDIKLINDYLSSNDIEVDDYKKNGKEHYVRVTFVDGAYSFTTYVPIKYRRAFLELNSEKAVADYLKSIKHFFKEEAVNSWFAKELMNVPDKDGIKYTFLRILLGSKGKRLLSSDFPQNPNAQKIIQGWRDYGYIISTFHGNKDTKEETPHWILPLPKINETIYEKMSKPFVKRVLKLLGGVNVFECRKTVGDLPDHKFSEVRWDENTPEANDINITESEAKAKFQILDTQRNQQKREVCRHCFETGERGTIYGIKFFFKGGPNWDTSIPQTGKEAERGCVGCPWYDIQKWREELQKTIDKACHK